MNTLIITRNPRTVLATLVRSPFDRTTLLGQYSRRVAALGAPGIVRQRAWPHWAGGCNKGPPAQSDTACETRRTCILYFLV